MPNRKNLSVNGFLQQATHRRTLLFSLLIIGALISFEIFNYSTTDFALSDLLGDLKFGGMRWATILAIAFCGIDFAGIAKLFTPETGGDEANEVWYLFGAWLIAAAMNAVLTWWGVSIAILHHQSLGNAVIPRETLLKIVPIFVALMVWLIRVLIIGTFSVAGERLFWGTDRQSIKYNQSPQRKPRKSALKPSTRPNPQRPIRRVPQSAPVNRPVYSNSFSPKPKPQIDENLNQSQMNADSNYDLGRKTYS